MTDTATPNPPAAAPERATRPAAPRSQTLDIDCTLSRQVNGPADFLFQILALKGMDQQVLEESLVITPPLPQHIYADPIVGHRFLRLHADADPVGLKYTARVLRIPLPIDPAAREMSIADLPDDLLHHLNPTRCCESDHRGRTAQKMFGALPPGHARVQAIVDWIHDYLEYHVGSSWATTIARDVFVQRAGVCRDFARLGVTVCRALNILARRVVGYALFVEPLPDSHAVFKAYRGGCWVMFDATCIAPVDELIRIATGRDAKDVAFATMFGPATMSPLIAPAG